jgi:hypothetical protein
MAFKA